MPALKLQEFGEEAAPPEVSAPSAPPALDPSVLEVEKAASYEQGFKTGWDECTREALRQNTQVSEALARRLSEITLTREELRAEVAEEMKPLLAEALQLLLPDIAYRSFAPRLIEELTATLHTQGQTQIEIRLCPDELHHVETAIAAEFSHENVTLRGDPSLSLSQASIHTQSTERQLDLTTVLDFIDKNLPALAPDPKVEAYG